MEAAVLPVIPRGGSLSRRVSALRRLMPTPREAALLSDIQALFPSNVLGKTLEWDVSTGAYIVGNQTGAPANGVRILIYVVDAQGSGPVVPLQQLGYIDFTDLSTPQYDRLGVLLRLGNSTIADYHITHTVTAATNPLNTLRAVGRLNSVDLGEHADFDITATSDDVDFFELVEDLAGGDGTSLHIELGGDDVSVSILLAIGADGNLLEMLLTEQSATETFSGEVRFNGTEVATVTGTGTPTFIGANGQGLPQEQVQALQQIFVLATVFALVLTFGVLGPAALVF
jgi:hypothetical protein